MNVKVDKTLINPATYNFGYAYCWGHIPWDELPKRGKAIRRVYHAGLPWDQAGEPPMDPPNPWEPVTDEEMLP